MVVEAAGGGRDVVYATHQLYADAGQAEVEVLSATVDPADSTAAQPDRQRVRQADRSAMPAPTCCDGGGGADIMVGVRRQRHLSSSTMPPTWSIERRPAAATTRSTRAPATRCAAGSEVEMLSTAIHGADRRDRPHRQRVRQHHCSAMPAPTSLNGERRQRHAGRLRRRRHLRVHHGARRRQCRRHRRLQRGGSTRSRSTMRSSPASPPARSPPAPSSIGSAAGRRRRPHHLQQRDRRALLRRRRHRRAAPRSSSRALSPGGAHRGDFTVI